MPDRKGFSLIEAAMSLALGAAFLASVYSSWFFCTKVWNQESLRSKLRSSVEFSMEKIKEDIRLSDGNNLLFYPQNSSSYTAVSLPRAAVDSAGFLGFSGGSIAWDKTVIYHLYQNGAATELRRTVFNSFDPSSSSRQNQLNSVVANGSGSGLAESSTTRALFSSETASFSVTPQAATFDGYAAGTARSANTSFGSKKLTAGTHQVRFEITGKNASSSGFEMGLDELSLTPSGGLQELEVLPVSASSGQTQLNQDMTSYSAGVWGGNYQANYQSSGTGQYLTFDVYYDQWLESNFANMTYSNTTTTGTDPHLEISSRENQGLSPAWQADSQTQATTTTNQSVSDQSYRCVIFGSGIVKSAKMIRLRFDAASNQALAIQSAYFGLRQGSQGNGTAEFASPPQQLFFDNAPVAQGAPDPVGSMNPGVLTSVNIPAGYHAWTNWFEYTLDPSSGPMPDFLVSFYVPSGSMAVRTLNPIPSPPVPVHAYSVDGNNPTASNWQTLTNYQSYPSIFSLAELAGWNNAGDATSQVYDTKLSSPAYGQITWNAVLPSGATASLKVRSSANPNMAGASSWSSLPNYTASPASLSGVSNLRYVQFQAILNAAPPYTAYPRLDNIKITWPGSTVLVEIGGYFTRRPDYGVFKVLVDGEEIVKALEIKLSASQSYKGRTYSFSLNSEGKTRNTGK
jgi:hypothetical protein